MLKQTLMGAFALGISAPTFADSFMDAKWAAALCEAWNTSKVLSEDLVRDEWMANNSRGYKLIRMFREECGEVTQIQLTIEARDGKAFCSYGGAADDQKLEKTVDYQLSASDRRWTEMGSGEYGPFKAMMFGYITVKGPYDEAMYHMKPFSEFLALAGAIPGEKGAEHCPSSQ